MRPRAAALSPELPVDGVLVIDKPAGPTSHDVVTRLRRVLHERRIGHTGTLDPLATGVLALVIGRATRLARFLSGADKTYDAVVRLGFATDTYDAEGTRTGPQAGDSIGPLPGRDRIARVLDAFRGELQQVPPPYSAKRVAGVRAYALARRSQAVMPAPAAVRVSQLELVAVEGDTLRLVVTGSAGFYVRSLAHDLGLALGCGAHLVALRRTRSGEFEEAQSLPLAAAEGDPAGARARVVPLDDLLPWMETVTLTARGAARASHGNALAEDDVAGNVPAATASRPAGGAPSLVRLVSGDGRLLGIAERGATLWPLRPSVVLV